MAGFSFNPNAAAFVPGVGFTPASSSPAAQSTSDVSAAVSVGADAQSPLSSVNEISLKMQNATLAEQTAPSWDYDSEEEKQKKSEEESRDGDEGEVQTQQEETSAEAASLAEELNAKDEGASKAESGKTSKPAPDARAHLNIVFIGHVDAGKSTTCGNILFLTGGVDARTIEKYEREAKEKNRESWFLAFVMDTNEEERQKGKTVEVGRAYFSTPNRRFTLLDAPGHKAFVPNMIEGAAQADVGVLIISARKGEFETGFEKGGQTREHTLLAKTLGVSQLIAAINKMDEPTCQWDEARYREILRKTETFFRNCGFVLGKNLSYVPISGLAGQNLIAKSTNALNGQNHVSKPDSPCFESKASWYDASQPTLFELLDSVPPPTRKPDAPLRVTIIDGYKDSGVIALGKVEAGVVESGSSCLLMPNKKRVKVAAVLIEDDEVAYASVGENVRLKILGCEDDALSSGCVLCPMDNPTPVALKIRAIVKVMELLEHRPLITAGYTCVMHVHTAREEVMLGKIHESTEKKKKKENPQFVKSDSLIVVDIMLTKPMCMEEFDVCSQLGRFTLRDEGKTIAAGRVCKILETV